MLLLDFVINIVKLVDNKLLFGNNMTCLAICGIVLFAKFEVEIVFGFRQLAKL